MPQTTYSSTPAVAYPGMAADSGVNDNLSAVVEESGGIKPGLLVVRGVGGDRTARLPPAVVADADSIKTNIGSTAGVQSFTTSDFNGVIGAGLISPPAKIDLVLSSHADWDATNATLVYEDEHGVRQTETLAIPNGGNATVTSSGYASRVISLSIPAQSSTGGTATLGTSATRTLGGGDVLGVSLHSQKGLVTPGQTDNEKYEDDDVMPYTRNGRIYVTVENAFAAGDRPLVRCIATGAEQLGAFRVGDSDSGDCFPVPGLRLMNSGAAGALGVLEVDL